MKTDRLYAMTLYLLNHGKASASELAKHFEVSVRTIQRDIDALCQAGIPIYAITGTNGGYEILSDYKMNSQLASEDEYAYMAMAIKGLKTVTNNPTADDIYEKITAMSNHGNTGMILDFSVLREGDENLLQVLQLVVKNKQVVNFSYTNNKGKEITTKISLRCHGNAIYRIKEYLNGKLLETLEDGSVLMEIYVVENEQWWIGVVLSQGKDVEVIEPEHIKKRIIGYAKEIIRLYFPAASLCRLLQVEGKNGEELFIMLEKENGFTDTVLGKITFSLCKDNRIEVCIPSKGATYVHECVPNPSFLASIIELFQENHNLSIKEINACFAQFNDNYVCEKMAPGTDFDYVLYFPDHKPDAWYYCVKAEMGHTIYHRFTREDYLALIG